MPIASDPNETFKIILKCDEGKSPQPAFIYRHLTFRQHRQLGGFRKWLEDNKGNKSLTTEDLLNKTIELASMNLTGWENMLDSEDKAIPFDREKFEDIITEMEAHELIIKLENSGLPTLEDKKKSDSQSDSGSEAADTRAGGAAGPQNAGTDRAN